MLAPWNKSYDQPRRHIKKQRHYFANKCPPSQSYGFSNSHVWIWELDCEESWVPKNWCFWTAVLEKTLESPLDCKEIQPVHPKGIQSWIFIGRTDVEAETPILWPPDAKNWLIGKDLDVVKDWRQEEKGMTEDEMAGWNYWLAGHEFEQALGVGNGQGSLACCSPWGSKESDTTEWLNWTELNQSKRGSSPYSSLDSFIRGMVFSVYKRLVHKILQKGDGQGGGGYSHHTISLFTHVLLAFAFFNRNREKCCR